MIASADARVTARGLAKSFGALQAVDDVSFVIHSGEVLGLLGPNGAGKSTTIELCAGLQEPDTGSVSIDGTDLRTLPGVARQQLGVALQATGLQDAITPHEALRAFGACYARRVAPAELLQRFGLAGKADARFGRLSGGERQRLALALALVNDPAVVFLDEPTAQLDPPMRREFHDHIRRMKREGRALLLATHDMEEASELCDRVIVLNGGRVVAEGTCAQLVAGAATRLRVQVKLAGSVESSWLDACDAIGELACDGGELRFGTRDLNRALAQVTAVCSERGLAIIEVNAGRGQLEDLIVTLSSAGASGARP